MNPVEALHCIVRQACAGELVFPTNMAASLRLQRALDDPDCHLEKIADKVLAEPLIAARLVAIANSVAYTRCGGHVSDVRRAVSLLGFKPLQALVAVIVVRQLAEQIVDSSLRRQADQLWQHSVQVAALAKIIAREFTSIDPETALFAGVVHEIDGFYLLSRAAEYPGFPQTIAAQTEARQTLSTCILKVLKIPQPVASAVAAASQAVKPVPPVSISDVLCLANRLSPEASPLHDADDAAELPDDFDFSLNDKTLRDVLSACADEIRGLTDGLQA